LLADQTIVWDHASTPMKNYQSLQSNDIVEIESESPAVVKATEQMKQILEAKYETVDIKDLVAQCNIYQTLNSNSCFQFLTHFSHCLMAHLDIGRRNIMI
jgi:DNA-binding transcriptional regulator YhcF (GntR family)